MNARQVPSYSLDASLSELSPLSSLPFRDDAYAGVSGFNWPARLSAAALDAGLFGFFAMRSHVVRTVVLASTLSLAHASTPGKEEGADRRGSRRGALTDGTPRSETTRPTVCLGALRV